MVALAMIAGILAVATLAMTVTTALRTPWPQFLFQALAGSCAAALILGLSRNLSYSAFSFALGVMAGAAPALWIAATHEVDHWDDFMTWLGNGLYIWQFGTFPTPEAPPVASVWPGYPPGSSLLLAGVWSAFGRLVENAGPVLNVACLLLLPGLILTAVGRGHPQHPIGALLTGALLGVAATTLNPGLDWHWVLSSLPEPPTLVAFAAAFVLGAKLVAIREAKPVSHYIVFASILTLITNLKQTGIILVALLMLGLLVLAISAERHSNRSLRKLLGTLCLVCAPSAVVWFAWQIYRSKIFPAEAFGFRSVADWHFDAVPNLLTAIAFNMAEHWLFFLPVALAAGRGCYVLGRLWWIGRRISVSFPDRLAILFAIVEVGYLAFLFVCYLGAFSVDETHRAAEFFRYQSQLGGAGVIVAAALIVERVPRSLAPAAIAVASAAAIATAVLIFPKPGLFHGKGVYEAAEVGQVRDLGRAAGDAMAKAEKPLTVHLIGDDDLLAFLIIRYEIWARNPDLVKAIAGESADRATLPAKFQAAFRDRAPIVALEKADGAHCAVYGDGERLELLVPKSLEISRCRPLLLRIQRAADPDRNDEPAPTIGSH